MQKLITLETTLSANESGLADVSLITTGIEASGHGIFLDEKTAETTMQKLLGRSVKSYLKHDGAGGDRIGEEIGFFSGIYRQGSQIKAKAFDFLDSFKRSSGQLADKLMEMARRIPDQFGVSLVLEYRPVWVMSDGSERDAAFLDTPPEGALRPIPSMRVLNVISADWVGMPAANPNGVFSVPVDAEANKQTATQPNTMTENQTETINLSKPDHEKLIADLAASQSKAGEMQAALAAKDGQITALEAEKIALGKEKDVLTAALAAANEAHKAELSKAVADAVAPLQAKIGELETFDARKLGVAPLELSRAVAINAAKQGELPEPAKTDRERWDQFDALQAESPEKAAKFKAAYLSRK